MKITRRDAFKASVGMAGVAALAVAFHQDKPDPEFNVTETLFQPDSFLDKNGRLAHNFRRNKWGSLVTVSVTESGREIGVYTFALGYFCFPDSAPLNSEAKNFIYSTTAPAIQKEVEELKKRRSWVSCNEIQPKKHIHL